METVVDETVTISIKEYRNLLHGHAQYRLLVEQNVYDMAFVCLPYIDDYDTIAEWQAACEEVDINDW